MNKLLAITVRHWKWLLCLNVLVFSAAIASFMYTKKTWTASTQLILPSPTSNLSANLGTLGSLTNNDPSSSTDVNPLKVQVSILTSDALLEHVLASDPEKSGVTRLSSYKRLFNVLPQERSTIISVLVSGSSPKVAQQRANNLIQAYQRRLNELRQANSQMRLEFSQKELQQAQARLAQAQVQLAQFRQSTGLANVEEQTKGIVSTINTLTAAKAQAIALAKASESRVQVLSTRLSLVPAQAIRSLGLGENQDYQFVRRKLSEVQAQLVQKRATFRDSYPQIQSLLTQRQQLQSQLQQYVARAADGVQIDTTVTADTQGRSSLIQQLILAETEASAQDQQAQLLESQIQKLNTSLKFLPTSQQRLVELQRQVDVAEGVYKGLVAQVQQNNIDAFNAYPNVQVLDPPRVDPKPTSPKKSLAAINAALASVIGSIALLLFLEKRNPLLTPKDLQAVKFRLVAKIPRRKLSGLRWQLGEDAEIEFQRLASAISLQPLDDHRLLITSAVKGEGKTTVTLGLALALVDLGFRVLVVDGDLRQAELSRRFGYTTESKLSQRSETSLRSGGLRHVDAERFPVRVGGLANPVCDSVWAGEGVIWQPVSIKPNLDLLPTLPKSGKEIVQLVRRGRFESVLSAAQSSNDYDYVLIDSVPVSLTSETALMIATIPNVLFVVRPGTSNSYPVNESLDQLIQHNAQLFGLVVNGEETKSRPYSYRYRSNNSGSLINS
ncbi:exopolysaccharide biosynthesis protein [Nostocales cyanobacterium HT-58-2]|nr:exopolysaccharide biosynthesis protein [Nostocales cyanobacterium HT-58-2]